MPHGSETCCRATELRHFGLYWVLAEERHGRAATVERLEQLALVELEALSAPALAGEALRMHSPGVDQVVTACS